MYVFAPPEHATYEHRVSNPHESVASYAYLSIVDICRIRNSDVLNVDLSDSKDPGYRGCRQSVARKILLGLCRVATYNVNPVDPRFHAPRVKR
jgi:hypothetical protein